MRILGIDPGYATLGYGALEHSGIKFTPLCYGAILTEAGEAFPTRLLKIYRDLCLVLDRVQPEAMAVERIYFQTNRTTAIDVAQARGIVLLAAAERDVAVFEYTPLQVKQAVVGYGKAQKRQVMEMTRRILNLTEVPKPDDTADALAIAICHAHSAGSALGELVRKAGAR